MVSVKILPIDRFTEFRRIFVAGNNLFFIIAFGRFTLPTFQHRYVYMCMRGRFECLGGGEGR